MESVLHWRYCKLYMLYQGADIGGQRHPTDHTALAALLHRTQDPPCSHAIHTRLAAVGLEEHSVGGINTLLYENSLYVYIGQVHVVNITTVGMTGLHQGCQPISILLWVNTW